MQLDPVWRLRCPGGGAGSAISFLTENSLVVGDTSGTATILNINRRRADLIFNCDTASVQNFSTLGGPTVEQHQPRMMLGNRGGTVLHAAVLDGSAGSHVLLQQQNSRMTLLDLNRTACEETFKTGVVSFCRFDVPRRSTGSERTAESVESASVNVDLEGASDAVNMHKDSFGPACSVNRGFHVELKERSSPHCGRLSTYSSSSFSQIPSHIFIAAAGDGESVGMFDMRALGPRTRRKEENCQVVTPGVSMSLGENTTRRALSGASSAGSVQCVGFDTFGLNILAAYEYPSVAVWDPRQPSEPVELLELPETKSPPTAMCVAWSRVWVACIEGEISLLKYDAKPEHAKVIRRAQSAPDSWEEKCHTPVVKDRHTCDFATPTHPANEWTTRCVSVVRGTNAFGSSVRSITYNKPLSSSDLFGHFGCLDPSRLHLSCLSLRQDALLGLAGCSSGALRLYEGRKLKSLGAFKAHDAPVGAVAFSDLTGFFVSADRHGVVAVWNLYAETYHKSSG